LWKCNSDSFQVNDLQGDLDVKDGKISELQNEVQAQAETAARQNTIIHSLRGRLQVLDQTDKSVSSLYLSSS
jgi:outer membrane murein-binding lipoprotein Lpp